MSELERRLSALGEELAYPPTPDIAAALQARLAERRPARRPPLRRLGLVCAVLVLLLAATAAAVPAAREAVLEWVGIEGVEIRVVPEPPGVVPGATLALGERLPLEEAQERTGVPALVPSALGEPDAAYAGGDRLTLRWGGLLLTLAPSELERIEKEIGPGTRAAPVDVRGAPGVYVDGAPHGVRTEGSELRIAGNTLLWARDGLVLRLEGARSREEALRIARSVR